MRRDERRWVVLLLTERGVDAAADEIKGNIRRRLADDAAEITVPASVGCAFVRYEHPASLYDRSLRGTRYVLEPQRQPGTAALATVSSAELDAIVEPVVEPEELRRGEVVTITGGFYKGLEAVARRVEQTSATVYIQLLTLKRQVRIPRGWLRKGEMQ